MFSLFYRRVTVIWTKLSSHFFGGKSFSFSNIGFGHLKLMHHQHSVSIYVTRASSTTSALRVASLKSDCTSVTKSKRKKLRLTASTVCNCFYKYRHFLKTEKITFPLHYQWYELKSMLSKMTLVHFMLSILSCFNCVTRILSAQ